MNIARHNRAFTVTEMLFVLMLFSIAGVLAMRLFSTSMKVIRTAPASQDRMAAIDRATASLRQDVWSATKIDLPDSHTLVLSAPDQTQVRWQFDQNGVTRSLKDKEQHWPMSLPLLAERRGSEVVLKGPDDDELRFTCAMLAMNGAKP